MYKSITRTRKLEANNTVNHQNGLFVVLEKKSVFEFDTEESRQKFLAHNANQKPKRNLFGKITQWFIGCFLA